MKQLPYKINVIDIKKKFVCRNGLKNRTELCRHMKNLFFIIHDVDKDDMMYYKQCILSWRNGLE